MLRNTILFGFKNFKQDIGLPRHITVKGTMKRLTRMYPKTYNCIRFSFSLSMTITLSLALIPGCTIPGQKDYKNFLINKVSQLANLWFMQGLSADPYGYILLEYRILEYQIEQQTASQETIIQKLSNINEIFRKGTLEKTNYSITPSLRAQHLLNSINILDLLIEYKKSPIDKNKASNLLKSKQIKDQFEMVLQNSVINYIKQQKEMKSMGRNSKQHIFDSQTMKSMVYCLKIIEFLLKFPSLQTNLKALFSLNTIVNTPGWEYISKQISQNHHLKSSLKKLYHQSPATRTIIIQILQTVDKNITKT